MRAALGVAVVVAALVAVALLGAGRLLVVADPLPPRADAIVILAGSVPDRTLEAADLYRAGLAPRVVVTRERLPRGQATLRARGVRLPEGDELTVTALHELGVPPAAIVILRRRAGRRRPADGPPPRRPGAAPGPPPGPGRRGGGGRPPAPPPRRAPQPATAARSSGASSPRACISRTMSHPPMNFPPTYTWGIVGQLEKRLIASRFSGSASTSIALKGTPTSLSSCTVAAEKPHIGKLGVPFM